MTEYYNESDLKYDTYIIVRSSVTSLLGKGEIKGDFNLFKKTGKI
jgi:hypothetical protein